MDELITELETATQLIVQSLDRIDYIELSEFVDQRQILVDQVDSLMKNYHLTSSQKLRIEVLIKSDELIALKVNELKEEARVWIEQRNKAKVQRSAYEAGYSPDSILMDRRK